MANPSSTATSTLTIRRLSAAGDPQDTRRFDLAPLQHIAGFLHEDPFFRGLDNYEGTVEVTATQPVAAVGLRFDGSEVAALSTIIPAQAGLSLPSGAIIMWDGVTCPVGYNRLTAFDGRFLVSSDVAGVTGGSNTHIHAVGTYAAQNHTHGVGSYMASDHTHGAGSYTAPSHTHSYAHVHGVDGTTPNSHGGTQVTNGDGGGGKTVNQSPSVTDSGGAGSISGTSAAGGRGAITGTSAPGGAGGITGESAPADNRPQYATIILCKRM
ncbi:MAG: hypothetical protein HY645_09900 [Acidobacteria bacterium]|nr:hypothetical protein [Acidobacteriota bacterium]